MRNDSADGRSGAKRAILRLLLGLGAKRRAPANVVLTRKISREIRADAAASGCGRPRLVGRRQGAVRMSDLPDSRRRTWSASRASGVRRRAQALRWTRRRSRAAGRALIRVASDLADPATFPEGRPRDFCRRAPEIRGPIWESHAVARPRDLARCFDTGLRSDRCRRRAELGRPHWPRSGPRHRGCAPFAAWSKVTTTRELHVAGDGRFPSNGCGARPNFPNGKKRVVPKLLENFALPRCARSSSTMLFMVVCVRDG
jgi:hypothetical protein